MKVEDVPTSTEPVRLKTVSVSQLNAYERCPRRWFLGKVRRVPTAQKPSAAVGVEVHRILEGWFKRGVLRGAPEHMDKARAAVAQLPAPDPALLVEQHFSLPFVVGERPEEALKFTGVIDLVDPRRDVLDLIDHKTTSRVEDLRREPVDLLTDPQMLTYAEWGYRKFKPRMVRVAHNTISTKHKARVLPLNWVEIPRHLAAVNWRRQARVSRGLVKLALAPPADFNDVPCNTDACTDFGGCDFVPLCSVKNPMVGVTKMAFDDVQASELLAKLSALKGPATASPMLVPEAAILPPDAAPRETAPAPEAAASAKRGRPKKAAHPTDGPHYEYDLDRELTTITVEALNARGAEGWELIGFHDGIVAVYKRKVA